MKQQKQQKQTKKTLMKQVKTKPHLFFSQLLYKKLHDTTCVAQPLTSLCGGWYIQTFKQVSNKLCKNKSSPLPLFFPNVQSMQPISKNKQLLKEIFQVMDTRELGRIDACQLYCAFLILSKGTYEVFLKSMVDIFGFSSPGRISRNEFFFFLDSFYRMLPKILILKGYTSPSKQNNLRLEYTDINKFLDSLYDVNRTDIQRNEIYQLLMKLPELNEFLKYLQKKCTTAAQSSRLQALNKMKFQAQIRNCMSDIVMKVQMALQKKRNKMQMILD